MSRRSTATPLEHWRESESQIAVALRKLTSEGGDSNFLIVSCGDAYVQFAGAGGSTDLYCEAVGNQYLPRDRQLAPDKIGRLEQLGFDLDADPPQFSRQFKLSGDCETRELAATTLDILTSVYDCHPDSELNIELRLE